MVLREQTMTDKYSINNITLQFIDKDTESTYKKFIIENTIWFCRIAWGLIILLGGSFGLLDRYFFGDDAGSVLFFRFILLSLASIVIVLTFIPRFKQLLDWSSFFFILSIGTFCIYLTALSDPAHFSPYFTGIILACTGIFSTVGLGLKYSYFALLLNLLNFNLVAGILWPVSLKLYVIYNFYLFSIIVIFLYIAYMVEYTSRRNFSVSDQLRESLAQVKELSGLIPICASCKNIRDDKGYWNQIESYISEHSMAEFSHSICPTCIEDLYPELKSS